MAVSTRAQIIAFLALNDQRSDGVMGRRAPMRMRKWIGMGRRRPTRSERVKN
ncbi:hypothetical protein J6590_094738 [Homalodisca vitripennis]|nr:hypothetical protein J6590_094738 [Homalodisca vitripennis]